MAYSPVRSYNLQIPKIKEHIIETLLHLIFRLFYPEAVLFYSVGLQFENVAPQEYFLRIVNSFEHQVIQTFFLMF